MWNIDFFDTNQKGSCRKAPHPPFFGARWGMLSHHHHPHLLHPHGTNPKRLLNSLKDHFVSISSASPSLPSLACSYLLSTTLSLPLAEWCVKASMTCSPATGIYNKLFHPTPWKSLDQLSCLPLPQFWTLPFLPLLTLPPFLSPGSVATSDHWKRWGSGLF